MLLGLWVLVSCMRMARWGPDVVGVCCVVLVILLGGRLAVLLYGGKE